MAMAGSKRHGRIASGDIGGGRLSMGQRSLANKLPLAMDNLAMANLEDPKQIAKPGWLLQGQHGPVGVFRAGRVRLRSLTTNNGTPSVLHFV